MHPSPLLSTYQAANAPLLTWGGGATGIEGAQGIEMPAALNPIEIEYAAIRKHCALLDLPTRATLELRGPEAIAFLNRMVTQELKPKGGGFDVGHVRRSLWLNRKGRIDADLRIIRLTDRLILELDALAAERTTKSLTSFIITEECELVDMTQKTHRLSLHGPTAWELLRSACTSLDETSIAPATCIETAIANAPVIIYREDTAGVPGFELILPAQQAAAVIGKLVELGHDSAHANFESLDRAIALRQANNPAAHIRMLPIGWHAYNIARVEAKTPLFHVDFGMENLPAETGDATLKDRVSFTKGCYLGQEVVARMHARKQCKQSLMFVRFDAIACEGYPPIPAAGAALLTGEEGSEQPIGAITSAVPSPLRSMACVAFAQVKTGFPVCTRVRVETEGVWLRGTIEHV